MELNRCWALAAISSVQICRRRSLSFDWVLSWTGSCLGQGFSIFLPYPEKPLYLQLNSHSSFFRQEACSSIQKLHMAQGPWDGEPLSGLSSGQGGPTKGDLLN